MAAVPGTQYRPTNNKKMPADSAENRERLSQDSQSSHRDSNLAPPEYKSEVLRLEPTCSVERRGIRVCFRNPENRTPKIYVTAF
jgi:hypothetical protein